MSNNFAAAFLIWWFLIQCFVLGYAEWEALHEVEKGAYKCTRSTASHDQFEAGLARALVPLSFFVRKPPEVVEFCAAQRAKGKPE